MAFFPYSVPVDLIKLVIEGKEFLFKRSISFNLEVQGIVIGNNEKVANAIKYSFELPADKINKEGVSRYEANLTITHITNQKPYNFADESLLIDVLNNTATFKGHRAILEEDTELKEFISSHSKDIKFDIGES